ncbi:MAG TPA: response regulator transcription factor [Chloroflexota bacterium]
MSVTVILADDHAVVREGLRMVLDAQPDISVIGEAGDGRQALDLAEELRPQVVVMDIAMPNLNGLEATRQIVRRVPGTRVVILTMHDNPQYLLQIVKAGAISCVLKRSAGRELVMAVEAAAQGQSYFSPPMATVLLEDYRRLLGEPDESELLSHREREILQLIAEGRTNREIADDLTLSIKTVQAHRAHITEKLGAHGRDDLMHHAMRLGMVTPE